MREVKFRAWHKKEKYMTEVVGMWHREVHPNGHVSHDQTINIRRLQGIQDLAEGGDGDYFIACTPRELEVMQHTGLTDKNGKEIYEGDVITHSNDGMIGVVTWSEGLYRFVIENLEQTEIIADLCDYDFEPEVLGNIYENPELLK